MAVVFIFHTPLPLFVSLVLNIIRMALWSVNGELNQFIQVKLFSNNRCLLADVEAVQEFTNILVLHGGSWVHSHFPDVFLSEEVSHFNKRSTLRDGAIDGKVSIDSPHLVHKTKSYALEHVLDVTAHSSDGSQLFLSSEPFLNLDGFIVSFVDVNGKMLEAFDKRSPVTLDGDHSRLDGRLNSLRNANKLKRVDLLHFPSLVEVNQAILAWS